MDTQKKLTLAGLTLAGLMGLTLNTNAIASEKAEGHSDEHHAEAAKSGKDEVKKEKKEEVKEASKKEKMEEDGSCGEGVCGSKMKEKK